MSWSPCWHCHSIFVTMQQEVHSTVSYEQHILLTVLFVLQCIIICSAFFARKAPVNWPGLPFLYALLAAGVVVGTFLVVAMWCGLWGFSSGYWADYHLYTALLWSMLVEVSECIFVHELDGQTKLAKGCIFFWFCCLRIWRNQYQRQSRETFSTVLICYWNCFAGN